VTRRPKIAVIGGGLAGIAACELMSRDPGRPFDLFLLEGRPHLGGRVGSYTDKETGKEVDTGQHLFLSCYTETQRLLDQLGTRKGLVFFDRLLFPLWDRERGLHSLDVPGSDNPLATASGLLQYGGLPISSRLAFLKLSRAIPKTDSDVDHLSAHEFLKRAGQPEAVIARFWELVILSATNLPSKTVSAAVLVRILKESLLKGGSHTLPGYNAIPLAELFVRPAMDLLSKRGVEIRLKTRVTDLTEEAGRITGIRTSTDFIPLGADDHLLIAVPPWSFEKLAPPGWQGSPLMEHMSQLSYPSPILSIHLHLDSPVHLPVITGFHESKIHWLFNKEAMEQRLVPEKRSSWFDWSEHPGDDMFPTSHVGATVSGAGEMLLLSDGEIGAICLEHIRRIDRHSTASLKLVRAVRDRFATPVLGVGQSTLRPDPRTSYPNLWIAGDTTDTGLPATMEGAIRSGTRAGTLILGALSPEHTPNTTQDRTPPP
jgi:squalene-associated FAD-dependent desaturase